MTAATQELGALGERQAEQWLVRSGWRILSRRFRSGHRDIDLVAERDTDGSRTIAFIEVKTRTSDSFGGPIAAVHWRKQREISRAARDWMSKFRRPGENYRFDVIAVTHGTGVRPEIIHLENAFLVR